MPTDLRPDAFYKESARAAGMTNQDIDAVTEAFRAEHAGELRIPRAWRPALNTAVTDAARARRAGAVISEAVQAVPEVEVQPEQAAPIAEQIQMETTPAAPAVEQVQLVPVPEQQPEPEPVIKPVTSDDDRVDPGVADEMPADDEQEAPQPEPEGDDGLAETEEVDDRDMSWDDVELGKAPEPLPYNDEQPEQSKKRTVKAKRLTKFDYSHRAMWNAAVTFHPGITLGAVKAAQTFSLVHNAKSGISFFGQVRLARMMGVSRSTAQLAIDALVKAGFLAVETVWREGRQGSNRYVLQMPEKVEIYRSSATFLASFGPDLAMGDDRSVGHDDGDLSPTDRPPLTDASVVTMTDGSGTNESKGHIEINESAERAAGTHEGSSPSKKDASDLKMLLPEDFEPPIAAVQRLRAAGLLEDRITASVAKWKERNAGKKFTMKEWTRRCGEWLSIERPDPVKASRMPEDWWPSGKAIDQLAELAGLKRQDVERLTAAFYHERRGAIGYRAESADWWDTWAAEILKQGGRTRRMAI